MGGFNKKGSKGKGGKKGCGKKFGGKSSSKKGNNKGKGAKGGKKGKGKNKFIPHGHHKMSPGVLVTADGPSRVTKAALEAMKVLNDMSREIRGEVRGKKDDEEEGNGNDSDVVVLDGENDNKLTLKRKRGEAHIDDEDNANDNINTGSSSSFNLADELAAEIAEIKEEKKIEKAEGWIYNPDEEPSYCMAFIRAPVFDIDIGMESGKDGVVESTYDAIMDSESSTNKMNINPNNIEVTGADNTTTTTTPVMPDFDAINKKLESDIKANGVVDSESDPKMIARQRLLAARELVYNKPTEVCHRVFNDKKLGGRFVIKLIPIDYMTAPHINQISDLFKAKLPIIFGTTTSKIESDEKNTETKDDTNGGDATTKSLTAEESTTVPGTKNDSISDDIDTVTTKRSSWNLQFNKRTKTNITHLQIIQAAKKYMPKNMYIDNGDTTDYTLLIEITEWFCGFSVLKGGVDNEESWRGLKYYRKLEEEDDDEDWEEEDEDWEEDVDMDGDEKEEKNDATAEEPNKDNEEKKVEEKVEEQIFEDKAEVVKVEEKIEESAKPDDSKKDAESHTGNEEAKSE